MAKDAATWKQVKFGEVVRLNKETCEDPASAGIERVVGLEHLEPGDLHVRSWGDVADGTTFTNRVRPGQVLFGKRRAYQRKVAVAAFDAICSGDIYVFESANPSKLLPELLPFICQTDSFFEHAVGTSAGSLSPRTNWTSLAEYEFALAPLEEQRRIADILTAAGAVDLKSAALLEAGEALLAARTRDILANAASEGPQEVPLGALCSRIGVGIASSVAHAYRPSGVPIIRNTDIKEGRIDFGGLLYVDPEFDQLHRTKRVRSGDVVITRTATDIPGQAAVVPEELDAAQTFTTLICTPDATRLDSTFLCHWINGSPGRSFIASRTAGSGQKNLNAGLLVQLPVRAPSLERQRMCVDELEKLRTTVEVVRNRRADAAKLLRAMREAALEPRLQ